MHRIKIQLRQEILEAAERLLEEAVVDARRAGVSWAVIGEGLGVTRQSAAERFGKLVA